MPIRRTYLDIKVDGKTRLTNGTPVNEFGPTSIAGAFLDMVATESDQLYNEIEYVHRALDPTRNFGTELDNLGYLMGVSRDSAYTALDDSDTNFYFYLDPRTNRTPGQLINNLYPSNHPMRQKLYDAGFIDSVISPQTIKIPANTYVYNSLNFMMKAWLKEAQDNSEINIERGFWSVEFNYAPFHIMKNYHWLNSNNVYIREGFKRKNTNEK